VQPEPYCRWDLVEERRGPLGGELVARAPIAAGTVVGCLTPGTPVALPIVDGVVDYGPWASGQTLDLAVEGDRLIALVKPTPAGGHRGPDLINHACAPNCAVEHRLVVRAARAIAAGEPLTFDYLAAGVTTIREGIACRCRAACPTVI
jgi:hypothetical protein